MKTNARADGTRGFTLVETAFVIAILTFAAVIITKIQPRVFAAQNDGRDQYVGLQQIQACAEKIITLRRKLGYANVTNTICNGLGGLGGYAADPTLTLTADDNSQIAACSSSTATCKATITIAKAGTAPAALTLQLSYY